MDANPASWYHFHELRLYMSIYATKWYKCVVMALRDTRESVALWKVESIQLACAFMIFSSSYCHHVLFWLKTTYLSLDLLFI